MQSYAPTTSFSELEDGEVNFVDFLPDCQSPGGIFKKAEYDNFTILTNRANDWLRFNPHYDIITCESIEFKANNEQIDPQRMVYLEFGRSSTWYVRGLRIWIKKCRSGNESAKQIGYMNVVPLQKEEGGIISSPVYESIEEVINRYNLGIRVQPLPGRIITIETVGAKVDSSGLDPDRSSWVERGLVATHFLFFLRIFYQESEPTYDEIGIKDFVPAKTSNSFINAFCKYEPFINIVAQANDWCSSQKDLRICNFQTVQTKLKDGLDLEANSQKMSYYEATRAATFYVRILRVAFIKMSAYSTTDSSSVTQFTCKTFAPAQLTNGRLSGLLITESTMPEFETLQQTGTRISAWTKATGSQMINMDTISLRLNTANGAECSSSETFTYNPQNTNEFWIYVIRAYIKGTYQEPRKEELPPLPEIQTKCCSIS